MGLSMILGIACKTTVDHLTMWRPAQWQHPISGILADRGYFLQKEKESAVLAVIGGKEHIPLFDDGAILIKVGKAMFEHLGCRVTIRKNNIGILTIFQNQPAAFDLIITNQTVPGTTDVNLARPMLQTRSTADCTQHRLQQTVFPKGSQSHME